MEKKMGYYYMSDTLSGLLKQSSEKDKKTIVQMLDHYIGEYKRIKSSVDAASTAYNFHQHIESLIRQGMDSPEGKQVKCKKGCSNCCHIPVDITRDEAILIHEYCQHEEIKINTDKLKRQSKYDLTNWFEQPKEDWPCVFLNLFTKSCTIYEYRPVSCRKLYALSEPEFCDINDPDKKVCRFVNAHVEIISSAMMNATPSGIMPEILLNHLSKIKEV